MSEDPVCRFFKMRYKMKEARAMLTDNYAKLNGCTYWELTILIALFLS